MIQIGEPEAERRADPGEPQGRQGGVENDTRWGTWMSTRQWPTELGTVALERWLESYVCTLTWTKNRKEKKKESGPGIQSHVPKKKLTKLKKM